MGIRNAISAVAGIAIEVVDTVRDVVGGHPTHVSIKDADRLIHEAEVQTEAALKAKEDAENAKTEVQKELERVRREEDEARAKEKLRVEAERAELQWRDEQAHEQARRLETALREQAQLMGTTIREQAQTQRLADEESRRAAHKALQDTENTLKAVREEVDKVRREADAARAEAKQQAEAQRAELQRRDDQAHEEARRLETALREQAQLLETTIREQAQTQQRADEETRRALDAQRAAEAAAAIAEAEARTAQVAMEEAERKLREGIQPVVRPSDEDLRRAKERIDYRDGLYHFAVAGVAGSGKSSLINAFRGLRNRDLGASKTGIIETTLDISRFPDPDGANPFVWYDIPGAGTLTVRDWMYFNAQGLYVYDAIIVLFGIRFTATDVAILRTSRLFHIPTYIVRSKADSYVRNEMKEMGYDSQDEDQDASDVAKLRQQAQERLISATRQNVRKNLQDANLPDQRVYIVSNTTLLAVVKGTVPKKMETRMIDEHELFKDLLSDARGPRGPEAHSQPRTSSSAREDDSGTSVEESASLGSNPVAS